MQYLSVGGPPAADNSTHLCFFIFFRRFLLVLSMYISNSASAMLTSSARPDVTSRPRRLRVSSQAMEAPTRLTTIALASCRAASASASGEASMLSPSILPKLDDWGGGLSGMTGNGEEYDSKSDVGGCEIVSSGRWREKNWCSLRSWEEIRGCTGERGELVA